MFDNGNNPLESSCNPSIHVGNHWNKLKKYIMCWIQVPNTKCRILKNDRIKFYQQILLRLCSMKIRNQHVILRFGAVVKYNFGTLDSALRPRPNYFYGHLNKGHLNSGQIQKVLICMSAILVSTGQLFCFLISNNLFLYQLLPLLGFPRLWTSSARPTRKGWLPLIFVRLVATFCY